MNNIIIGLGFGDEGKGLVTDYLCSKSKEKTLVIRFSGGQQAGHTVYHNDVKHVFSNFGSGTLRGVPTYWSKFCTIDPVGISNELDILLEKGVDPILYIDDRCPVTTPYDKYHNQNNMADIDHGSCGVGVGSTINREEHFYSLTFSDLFYPWIFETKLNLIKQFYNTDVDIDEFVYTCHAITNSKNIKKSFDIPVDHYNNYVYEGSQGLLLDQHYGFFPHVTRSNTGVKNALEVIKDNSNDYFSGIDSNILYLVTRAYQTRHGNGPMTNEHLGHNIKDDVRETNAHNKYQGQFRKSLLDVSLLKYAIDKDEYVRKSNRKILVITCLDHIIDEYRFTFNNEIIYCDDENDFVTKISNILNINNVYVSKTPYSKDIYKLY